MGNNRIKVGITQGDTNGIGWEIIIKALADNRITEMCTPVIYGSSKCANYSKQTIKSEEVQTFSPKVSESGATATRGKVNLVECATNVEIEAGKATSASGMAAIEALKQGVGDLKSGNIDVLVTAPFNKEAVQSEEFKHTGHTEYLGAELEGEPLMIMCSEYLRVGLVTIHTPLSEVAGQISQDKIVKCLKSLNKSMVEDFEVRAPRIAVLSLNPHAGDGGLLGKEEQEIITPAIRTAASEGILAFGAFAADGFFGSGNYTNYDAILAMYHDQGLAPFKTISPEGVNFTAGLTKVRTSSYHGVSYDISG